MSSPSSKLLLGELMAYPFMYRGRKQFNLNEIAESGFYYVEKDTANTTNYIGGMLNFIMDQAKIQIIYDVFSGSLAYRVYRLSGSSWGWTGWKLL